MTFFDYQNVEPIERITVRHSRQRRLGKKAVSASASSEYTAENPGKILIDDKNVIKISSRNVVRYLSTALNTTDVSSSDHTAEAPDTVAPRAEDANNQSMQATTPLIQPSLATMNNTGAGVFPLDTNKPAPAKTESVPAVRQTSRDGFAKPKTGTLTRRELIERLTIYKHDFLEQPYRLQAKPSTMERLLERNEVMGPFKSDQDFHDRALTSQLYRVAHYSVVGHGGEIILREGYAEQLTRDKRAVPEEFRRRVKPSLIPSLLDELPNSAYVRRVFLEDRANAQDDYLTQTVDPHGFVTDMAMANGELVMYKYDLKQFLRRDVLHEWSHALRYHYWEDDLAWRFGDATDLEGVEWNWRKYGARNKGEGWAVLGEPLLGYSADGFLDAVQKAPIRSVIWMRALEKCFAEMSPANASVNHEQYVARLNFVKEFVTPLAITKLQKFATAHEKDSWQRASAMRILDYVERRTGK